MRKAGGGGGDADTVSGMWLLLTESGRGEVGRAGRSACVAALPELSAAFTCARWSHPPSLATSRSTQNSATGLEGPLAAVRGRPPSSGVFKDV